MLKEVSQKRLGTLLSLFQQCNGCVDFHLFLIPDEIKDNDIHRMAAIAGMEEERLRWEEYADRFGDPHRPRDSRWLIDYDERLATGQPIDVDTFLSTKEVNDYVNKGYEDVFFDPVYGCSNEQRKQLKDLFPKMNEALFGGLYLPLQIVSWSTEWSNYFAAGKEWWGAYLWTVHRPGSKQIAWIGASATD